MNTNTIVKYDQSGDIPFPEVVGINNRIKTLIEWKTEESFNSTSMRIPMNFLGGSISKTKRLVWNHKSLGQLMMGWQKE